MRGIGLIVLIILVLSGCSTSPKLGSAPRETLSDEELQEYLNSKQDGDQKYSFHRTPDSVWYNEDGVIVTSEGILEVETWKLHELSQSYEEQHPFDYVLDSEELEKQRFDWMTSKLTTKDFTSVVRLYGDADTMTLDIQLDEEYVGKFIIAPQSCIINGVLKNKTLFRVTESEAGHFLITANMVDFNELAMFGLNVDNISSLAWYLTAINTETRQMNSFLIATAFPDDYTWGGLQVSENFSAASGIVMWVLRSDSYTYLCTFNGSTTKIESDITVKATSGDLISDSFKLDVSSGELSYMQIGFDLEGITVTSGDTLLHSE